MEKGRSSRRSVQSNFEQRPRPFSVCLVTRYSYALDSARRKAQETDLRGRLFGRVYGHLSYASHFKSCSRTTWVVSTVGGGVARSACVVLLASRRPARGRFRSGSNIARMAKEIPAFLRAEIGNDTTDPTQEAWDSYGGRFAAVPLWLAEGKFDRVEVRRILRQINHVTAAASIASATPATLCTGRLSMSTISPRLRVGPRHSLHISEKHQSVHGSLVTNGAVIPRCRRAPTTRTAHQAGADGTTGREASWCKMPTSGSRSELV